MADKRVVYLTFSTVGGKSTSVTISAPRAGITLQDAKTAANALVANKVILGSGDAELAAFTTAREVKLKQLNCNNRIQLNSKKAFTCGEGLFIMVKYKVYRIGMVIMKILCPKNWT